MFCNRAYWAIQQYIVCFTFPKPKLHKAEKITFKCKHLIKVGIFEVKNLEAKKNPKKQFVQLKNQKGCKSELKSSYETERIIISWTASQQASVLFRKGKDN